MIGLISVATRAFQSTLPYGSDELSPKIAFDFKDFNPRSLTGATRLFYLSQKERSKFQSTLPYGSDRIGYCFLS